MPRRCTTSWLPKPPPSSAIRSGRSPGDILLYQLGTASPLAEFLLGRPEPLVLDYHNVTPAAFYDGLGGPHQGEGRPRPRR